jgi:bifunctional DNA-binding transcriptional regulator/antitoxin component of YhaV-PrlF toxin-antitoxin module
MALFLSTYTNKVDRKGRVSVPAPFRTALSDEAFQGIVLFRSNNHACLEGFGASAMDELSSRLDHFDLFSSEQDDMATAIPGSFEEHARLMFDLQLMAFRSDVTRVVSLSMARELVGRSYPQIGVSGNHHLISHHREDAELKAQKARIDTYHMQLLAYFLQRMRDTPDGDGSLLDHSAILFGSGLGDGNLHRHQNLPVLLAGKLHGKFQTGYHFDHTPDTPMANLLVTLLDSVGVPIGALGDSTGQLLLDYQRAV